MGDERNDLPEGTDTIIDTEDTAALPAGEGTSDDDTGGTVIAETTIVTEKEIPAPSGNAERPVRGSGSPETGLAQRFRDGGERLSAQAGERARGLVSQGLERSAETLSNVSRLVGDTAPGLDERLGPEFGEYARKAATAIENTANSIATKDADELIEDTRNFVRNSPGIAIAGAAIVGFALARLLKSGLSSRDEDDDA
jgi:ElaB/YqjD/DUF883 family membrane-anchored ribosome-binding protein